MNKKVLKILAVLIMVTLALGLFNINSFSTVVADENLENSTVQFLSSFYETRSEAIVNSSKANIFLNDYSGESIELRTHEANRINFYHNWIKQFNGTINEMHSDIYAIKDSFQVNNNKASIEVYEWITILWTREKENIDVNNLPVVKELEELYKTTEDPLLKENLPYRIEELKKEVENATTSITSGIGLYHMVVLLRKDDSWKILKDSYDEGADLTRSPDFVSSEESNIQAPSSSSKVNSSYTNEVSGSYYPQATYNPDNALWYADFCVDHYFDSITKSGHHDNYYNRNYIDFNPGLSYPNGGGGDCANYVSQCLNYAGSRMVKDASSYSNGWYYDNKGTGIYNKYQYNSNYTWLDDEKDTNIYSNSWSWSNSWVGVGSLRNFLTSHSRGYESSNLSSAIKGDVLENASDPNSANWHTMIVYSGGSTLLVDGHNNDRYHCPMSLGGYYKVIQMYSSYPLVLSGSEDFFYPMNFGIVRDIDCN